MEIEEEILVSTVDATQTRLIDYVEETMPRTIAGVAAKLRMLDDENWGVAAALARGIPLLSRTFSNESNGRPGSGAVRR